MAEPLDLLIEARWIIPIEPAHVVLEDHAVAVRGGRIVDLLPTDQAGQRYLPAHRVDLPRHVLLPGLVNLHTHAAMTLLRGIADDLPLMNWLQDRIWPAEAKHVSERFVLDGTRLACHEMLRGGITTFSDMYFFPDAAVRAATAAGMRCAAGVVVIEIPTAYATDPDDYLAKGLRTRDEWHGEPLVRFCMAPHAPYTVSDGTFERVLTLAEQLDLPIHLHIHETGSEVEDARRQSGERPLERLRRLGLVGPGLIGVHAVHLQEAELDLLARHGCSVAHCPTSNMKLASGAAPIASLLERGVRVGLGTDGAASNNRLDLFQEMRHAALLAKLTSGNAAAANVHQMLRMATLSGAEALGWSDEIGSIEAGKQADLCAVDLGDTLCHPCFDPASHLVYVAGREHVTDVWVAGSRRVEGGRLLQNSNSELLRVSELWQNKLSA